MELNAYEKMLTALLGESLQEKLRQSQPGHCLRLEGLPNTVLHELCTRLQGEPGTAVVLLSNHPTESFEVSATKLIELRNQAENSHVLLVFIPSNLRTAAEDSFDRATFLQIEVDDVLVKVLKELEEMIPVDQSSFYNRIVEFFKNLREELSLHQRADYILVLKAAGFDPLMWGQGLYTLGLIPDDNLLTEEAHLEQRLYQNYQAVECLKDDRLPLLGRITSLEVKPNSIQKPLFQFLSLQNRPEQVRVWGKIVAEDSQYSRLNFACWPIGPVADIEDLEIFVNPLKGRNVVTEEGGKKVPTRFGREVKINVNFETQPTPMQVNELTQFRIDLMRTNEDGQIDKVDTIIQFKKTSGRNRSRSKQVPLDPVKIDQGVFFFRVLGLDDAGTVLNRFDGYRDPALQEEWVQRREEQGDRATRDGLEGKLTCDSEDFLFVIEGEDEDVENQSEDSFRREKAGDLFQAIVKTHLDYIHNDLIGKLDSVTIEDRIWSEGIESNRSDCSLEVRFNDIRHHYVIPMASSLRRIEHQMLQQPEKLGLFRVDFSSESDKGDPHLRDNLLGDEAPNDFIEARKKVFNAILSQVVDSHGTGQRLGIAEICDLEVLGDDIENYLACYQQWMMDLLGEAETNFNRDLSSEVQRLQMLDCIEIVVSKIGGQREHIYAMTPLHPLRLAARLQRRRLFSHWEQLSLENDAPKTLWTKELEQFFLGGLLSGNYPLILHGGNLRSFYYGGELAPGWGAYFPVSAIDRHSEATTSTRALMGQVQNELGIPKAMREETDYSSYTLYRQIRRYLLQHPYIEVLILNVFNPGDGSKLIECMKRLQKEPVFEDLRYEFRLFTNAMNSANADSAFDEFLRPTGTVSGETDAFIFPSENSLFPKIRFSRSSIDDYLKNPQFYEAHLSVILDLFPVRTQIIKPQQDGLRSLFCHGLIVEPIQQPQLSSEDIWGWSRYLAINEANPMSEDDMLTDPMCKTLGHLQHLVALSMAGKWTDGIPCLSLSLKDEGNILLYHIHENSDWVVTIDRNFGIDLFDTSAHSDDVPYLLDYSPGFGFGEAPIFLTTRLSSEVQRLLQPHLSKFGLIDEGQDKEQIREFLEILRSVSGSVIMQLTASPNQAFETIGIGLSRLMLGDLDLLNDSIFIPLDMHKELFDVAFRDNTDIESRQRGDILLVSCDPLSDTVHFQVIEVKCRRYIGDGTSLDSLKTEMSVQLDQTVECLQFHFDPNYKIPDRLDREVKNHQLNELISFYLARAKRYGLVNEEALKDFEALMNNLHSGYKIAFNKIGLIFEFENENEEIVTTKENEDLVFFHAGYRSIKKLFNQITDSEKEEPKEDLLTVRDILTRRPVKRPRMKVVQVKEKESEESESLTYSDKRIGHDIPQAAESLTADADNQSEITHDSSSIFESEKKDQDDGEGAVAREAKEERNIEPPEYTDLIGDTEASPQYGVLGIGPNNRKVALDLNGCNTISLFGVPGSGKSYTVGTIVEMATRAFEHVNLLPQPLATVIFHFHESEDYPPEFVSMCHPNNREMEIEMLEKTYGAKPGALEDVVLLVPEDKVEERKREYPSTNVEPIAFSSQELSIKDWKFLMGAIGNQAMYMHHLNMIMRKGRSNLTLKIIREGVDASRLSDAQKEFALNRLELAEQFVDDTAQLRSLLKPGRLVIVDLRDEFIEKDQALGLFVVMLNIFAGAKGEDGNPFNKLIVFDEAHKYITHSDLTAHVVEVIRQMRHQGVTMLMASQDPPSLPSAVIELSSVILLHRFNSPQWLKHIQKSVVALQDLTATQLASLQPGDAFLWANKATNTEWTRKGIKVKTRPRITMHGGSTQRAVE